MNHETLRLPARVLLACALLAALLPVLAGAADGEAPGRARLKGRIGATELDLRGQCRLAQRGAPFVFWSDGLDGPAGIDSNRDGVYLEFSVVQPGPDAIPVASIRYAARGGDVLDGVAVSPFTLSGNTLSVDTRVEVPGHATPTMLRLAIVCDAR